MQELATAKTTLIGMYNFMNESDSDLFLNLALPAGIEKETLINTILMRGGEFEVIYANPYFMRDSILTWSKKWYWTFEKWLKVTQLEYNPIDNYDRSEMYTDVINGNIKNNGKSETIGNVNTSIEDHIGTEADSTINTTNDKAAFNVESYSADLNSDTTNHDENSTDRNGSNISDETRNENTSNEQNELRTITHNAHLRGNIGVTTTQQMMESEIMIAYNNMYENIADIFLQEYIIPVY